MLGDGCTVNFKIYPKLGSINPYFSKNQTTQID